MITQKQIVQQLITRNLVAETDIHGCSQAEIAALEGRYGMTLPQQYREFLMAIGHHAGEWLCGIDIFYEWFFRYDLTKEAQGFLDEMKETVEQTAGEQIWDFRLPRGAFVFCLMQGITFLYFVSTESDDPPVYQYHQGNKYPKMYAASFSEFLSRIINQGYISIL